MLPTQAIVRHIEGLGYVVKVFCANGNAEIFAIPLEDGYEPHIARCRGCKDEESVQRAACLLAEAIGIDLLTLKELSCPRS